MSIGQRKRFRQEVVRGGLALECVTHATHNQTRAGDRGLLLVQVLDELDHVVPELFGCRSLVHGEIAMHYFFGLSHRHVGPSSKGLDGRYRWELLILHERTCDLVGRLTRRKGVPDDVAQMHRTIMDERATVAPAKRVTTRPPGITG